MKTLIFSLLVATCAASHAATFESGESRTALVELYTSEGCSSCPPAEAWLDGLHADPGLWKKFVPVAFHVDYWDHLGWPDRFASPDFTRRQRAYAAAWNADSVYTPEFVCDGREWRSRTFPSAERGVGILRAETKGREVDVSFLPTSAPAGALVAEVAPLGDNIEVKVRGGENAGRNLKHGFVALGLASAAMERAADGKFVAHLTLPEGSVAPISALAVWVHAADNNTSIQAAGGWLKN